MLCCEYTTRHFEARACAGLRTCRWVEELCRMLLEARTARKDALKSLTQNCVHFRAGIAVVAEMNSEMTAYKHCAL